MRSGASTVTQQLLKLASGRTGRSVVSKAREMVWAWRLERMWGKDKILGEYLNRLPFGNLCVGIEAAARLYFGKPAKELTQAEAAFLAGIPRAPSRLNPWRHPEAAERMYQVTLTKLHRAGLLDGPSVERMRDHPPQVGRFAESALRPGDDPLVLALADFLAGRRGDVVTTLDAARQKQVETAVRVHLTDIAGSGATQAAMVVMENATGDLRVLVPSAGSRLPGGAMNLAMQPRAAGSALKPFLYAAALDRRLLTAATLLPDTPQALRKLYRDYAPENYDRRCHGPVRVREALASSLNIPAVGVLHRLGGATIAGEVLERWGIKLARSPVEYGAGLVLGNAEVSLLDLASAYAGLARGGRVRPWRLEGGQGIAKVERAASEGGCALVADILSDPEARHKTFGRGSVLELPVRVPVKTGTSTGFRDAWCVGFTREHTFGVWVGNADGRPLQEWSAIRAAAPLWRAVVELYLRSGDTPYAAPEGEKELHTASVCAFSGRVPCAASPKVVSEKFLSGTDPEPGAEQFFQVSEGWVIPLLPEEYAVWCSSRFNTIGAKALGSETLRLLVPEDGAVYEWDPRLSARQQALVLRCSGSGSESGEWRVNGQLLGVVGKEAPWPLVRGRHEVEVRTPNGRAKATFSVEDSRP
jgi:penicillin-binding protein 1C